VVGEQILQTGHRHGNALLLLSFIQSRRSLRTSPDRRGQGRRCSLFCAAAGRRLGGLGRCVLRTALCGASGAFAAPPVELLHELPAAFVAPGVAVVAARLRPAIAGRLRLAAEVAPVAAFGPEPRFAAKLIAALAAVPASTPLGLTVAAITSAMAVATPFGLVLLGTAATISHFLLSCHVAILWNAPSASPIAKSGSTPARRPGSRRIEFYAAAIRPAESGL
jgi:hypothetical protein